MIHFFFRTTFRSPPKNYFALSARICLDFVRAARSRAPGSNICFRKRILLGVTSITSSDSYKNKLL